MGLSEAEAVLVASGVLYWKPVAGVIRDRERAVDEKAGLPHIRVKIVFPPTFPAVSKTFNLEVNCVSFLSFRFFLFFKKKKIV